MYRTLEVLVINWEKLNCDKMEQFLTLLVSNDNEEPKQVEESLIIIIYLTTGKRDSKRTVPY